MNSIENIELMEWLNELKPYQKDSIITLLEEYDKQQVAEIWITSNGALDSALFGGDTQDTKTFFDNFKTEFQKFICGHPDYGKFREKLVKESPIIKSLYISVISGAIGSTIGFSAALLAPAVAILLSSVGQMGINSYCSDIKF